jgi:hypothetical protein
MSSQLLKKVVAQLTILIFGGVSMFLGSSNIQAQGLDSNEPLRTIGFGARIQTGGIGIEGYYNHRIDTKWSWFVSTALVSQKDRNEIRIESFWGEQGGSSYIFDKINYAYSLTSLYGREYTVSLLTAFSRLKLTTGLAIGPSLALLKPIYYEIIQPNPNGAAILRSSRYRFGPDPQSDYLTIYGEDNFMNGINSMSYIPGICLQSHVMLNLSGDFLNLKAVKTGFRIDWYSRHLNILDVQADRNVFFNLYVGLLVGNSW